MAGYERVPHVRKFEVSLEAGDIMGASDEGE
jgi:hypothetical protein